MRNKQDPKNRKFEAQTPKAKEKLGSGEEGSPSWTRSHAPTRRERERERAYEKESILRTLGAKGISINNEFEKNEIRLLASKLDGTSMADSFVVSSK